MNTELEQLITRRLANNGTIFQVPYAKLEEIAGLAGNVLVVNKTMFNMKSEMFRLVKILEDRGEHADKHDALCTVKSARAKFKFILTDIDPDKLLGMRFDFVVEIV